MRVPIATPRLALLGCCIAAACRLAEPRGDDRVARSVIADLQSGRIEAVRQRFDPAVAAQIGDPGPALRVLADSLRGLGSAETGTLVGWSVADLGSEHRAGLSYQLRGAARWAVVTVELRGAGDSARVLALRVAPLREPLERTNAFTLRDKRAVHYLTLVLAVACALAAVGAAITAARTPMRRRWAWVLAALVGVGTFQLNWATGAYRILPLRIQLLSAGAVRAGPYAPWIVSFSLPLGAALSLAARRSSLRRGGTDAAQADAAQVPGGSEISTTAS